VRDHEEDLGSAIWAQVRSILDFCADVERALSDIRTAVETPPEPAPAAPSPQLPKEDDEAFRRRMMDKLDRGLAEVFAISRPGHSAPAAARTAAGRKFGSRLQVLYEKLMF